MSTEIRPNPYLGHTHDTPRPDASQERFQALRPSTLHLAQTLWDAADAARARAEQPGATPPVLNFATYDPMTRDADREEPISKAVENRLRVAFLSKKGATVSDWNEQRATITAAYLKEVAAREEEPEPRRFDRGF